MNSKINRYLFSSPWSALALITITVTIIYSNIYNAPFVFDDIPRIVENEQVRDLSNYSSPGQILKDRNIVYLTFAINYKLCGLNVIGYHIFNVIVHIANGFLVYFLSLTIFMRMYTIPQSLNSKISLMSLFAALIFVVHPIQTQAVTYTVQRMASMSAMFYMASVFFYLKARVVTKNLEVKTKSRYTLIYYLLSGLCGALALMSKQNAASLPGAIILVEYLFIDRTWKNWKKMIPWFVFSFAFWVVFVSYIMGLLGVFGSGSGSGELLEGLSDHLEVGISVSRWQYLCTQFNVLVIYIRLLFLPIYQCLDYLYPYKDGFLDGYTPIAFSFLMGLVGVGVWSIRKRPIISLAIFWFFITLSVESSIIPLYAYFEHRLYLPMFGFAVFASWSIFHFLPTATPHRRLWVIVSYIVIIMSLGAATYHRNGVWQDKMKLWSDVVVKSPKSYRAYSGLGNALKLQDKPEEAISCYKEALRINPRYAKAHYNLGIVLAQQGILEKAIYHYEEALRINPNYAEVHNNMGNVFSRQGNQDKAIFRYRNALRCKPEYAEAHNNLGVNLFKQGKTDEAISHLRKASKIDSNSTEFRDNLQKVLDDLDKVKGYHNKGLALSSQGQIEDAITEYRKALRFYPNYAAAHNEMGISLVKQNKLSEAVPHFSKAIQIQPDNEKSHNNLGLVFALKGDLDMAIKYFSEALRINPDFEEAQYNLELALKEVDNND